MNCVNHNFVSVETRCIASPAGQVADIAGCMLITVTCLFLDAKHRVSTDFLI